MSRYHIKRLYASDLTDLKSNLFAKVVNVPEDDVLNVRANPDYQSNKIGEAHPSSIVGIDICLKNQKSIWCKIDILTKPENITTGWVNAKFLDQKGKHINRGYVKITGRPNACYYSIKCEEQSGQVMCMIGNAGFPNQLSRNAPADSVEWINRSKLHASTAFDAAPENSDGYCINGKMIDDYFK